MAKSGGNAAITASLGSTWDDAGVRAAQRDIDKFAAQTKQTGSSFDSFAGTVKGVGAALGIAFGAQQVVSFLRDSMQAAIEDEKSMVALAKAMDNVGLAGKNAAAEDFVRSMSLQYGVADDLLRPSLQRLVTATGDLTQAQGLLQTAMDVSAATGKDLNTVSLALAKAANGNIGALTRLGVPIDANIVKNKDFAAALDAVNQRFSGQAAAAADTYGGSLARIQVAAGEAQESIGYALLGAVEGVSEAFGGTGGAVEVITLFGEKIASMVTTVGNGVTAIADLVAGIGGLVNAIGNSMGATELWGQILNSVWNTVASNLGGPLYMIGQAYQLGADSADQATTSQMQHALSSERVAQVLAQAKAAQEAETQAVVDAKAAMDALKASVDHFNRAISQSQARDDLRMYIANLDEALKGNARSFKGVSDAAKENRDTLRSALSDAASIATTWGQQTGASADEIDAKYKAMRKKIIAGFKAEGFSAADIKAFMGKEGLWRTPAEDAVKSASDAATSTARPSFFVVGRQVAQGAASGISQNAWMVSQAARIMMLNAAAAARAAAAIKSPSKVFHDIGTNIVDGLILGLKSKDDKVKQASQDMMNALADKAREMVDGWDQTLADLKGKLDSANQAVTDWAKQTSSTLVSAFDISSVFEKAVDENGNFVADKFTSGFDAQMKQFEWYTNVLTAIKNAGGSDALMQFLMSQGVEKGGKYGQGLIDNGLVPYVNDKLALVQSTADTTAQAMVPAFLKAGVNQAQQMYEGFKANFGAGKPARVALENLMDRIADSLGRTVTVSVKTVYEAAGVAHRAAGGSLAAGQAAIVGEVGPELFVPSTSGTIIPNRALGGGGNSYAITVQAGVGDPRQIGQTVVEYIRKFEKANGPVFAAAS